MIVSGLTGDNRRAKSRQHTVYTTFAPDPYSRLRIEIAARRGTQAAIVADRAAH